MEKKKKKPGCISRRFASGVMGPKEDSKIILFRVNGKEAAPRKKVAKADNGVENPGGGIWVKNSRTKNNEATRGAARRNERTRPKPGCSRNWRLEVRDLHLLQAMIAATPEAAQKKKDGN